VENNWSHRSPYPGLRPFTEAESDLFFGRELHTAQLRSKLESNRFVVVVGTSGSGKSSLVRAGLIAQLKDLDHQDGAELSTQDARPRWRVAEMRPGGSPIFELARALVSPGAVGPERAALFADIPEENQKPALEGDAVFVAATLRRGPLGLAEVLRETPLPPDTHLLLFVDQFEEIFRFRNEGPSHASPESIAKCLGSTAREQWVNEAEAFVALLLETAARDDLGVHLLLTMRLDYLSDCAVFAGLPEAINASQYMTPRLTREQRGASIVAPARVCGGDVAPDLVNTLLNETGPESDQLPLLQHCLMRMWTIAQEVRAPGDDSEWLLTMDHYRDNRVGTLKSSLSNHANRIYTDLEKQNGHYGKVTETIFRCLTAQTVDKPDTRRPQPWAALRAVATARGDSETDVRLVLDAFRHSDCSFLTPPLETTLEDSTPIDISHESLIRNWDKLHGWVKAEAGSAEDYHCLEQAARRWKRKRADLLDSLALESILNWKKRENPSPEWAARYGGDFSLAMEFLNRSQEMEKKRISQRRQRRITALALALAVAGIVGFFVYGQVAAKRALLELKLEQLEEAQQRSNHFLRLAQDRLGSEHNPKKDVIALHYLSKALHLYSGNAEAAKLTSELLCRNIWCPALTPPLRSTSESPLLCATWGPDGNLFAVSSDGNLLRWNGNEPKLLPCKRLSSEDNLSTGNNLSPANNIKFTSAIFSDDGQRLLVIAPAAANAGAKAQVFTWSPRSTSYESNSQSIEIEHPSQYCVIASSRDGSVLVVISMRADHTFCQVFRYDGHIYQEIRNSFQDTKVAAACFSPDEKWLATVSPEGAVRLWDVAALEPATGTAGVIASFNVPAGLRPNSLLFGPGKDEMMMTVFSQPPQILNIGTGVVKLIGPPRGQGQIMRLAFTPKEANKRFAAIALNGRVEISSSETLDQPLAEPICFQGVFGLPRFSQDGKKVLVLSGSYWMALDTVQIWDAQLQEPLPEADKLKFDGCLAPTWLADLAEAESGGGRSLDDDDLPPTLSCMRNAYSPDTAKGEYEVIWRRFFSEPISHSY
jgi:WD40 repeat protein